MIWLDKHWGADFDFIWAGTGAAAANPQLQFFENFPGHLGAAFYARSRATLSVHAVNIPLSISFNNVIFLAGVTYASSRSLSIEFGLYSLNGSTLSLANSASRQLTFSEASTNWMSMVTSATQNITPGTWYFALNQVSSATDAGLDGNMSFYGNSSINPANAIPGGFLMGRVTASTTAMPASIATSDLDITGSDAIRQPYIILTA